MRRLAALARAEFSKLQDPFDTEGAVRIAKYVFCDQASLLTTDPAWTAQQIADGPIFTPTA